MKKRLTSNSSNHINVIISDINSNFRIYLHNKLLITLNFNSDNIVFLLNRLKLRMSKKIYLVLLITTLLSRFGLITTTKNPKDFY